MDLHGVGQKVGILYRMDGKPKHRWLQIHVSTAITLFFITPLVLGAEAQPYPLWDGHESVADYAKRVNLPPTKTLDLGGGVKMDLVLIPAGKFIMGTPEHEKPIVGQIMVGISGGFLFLAVLLLLFRAWRKGHRLQFSLALMLVMMFVASVGVWGGVRWNEALKHLGGFDNERPAHEVKLTQPFYMGKFDVTQEQYQQVTGTNPSQFPGKNNPVETVSWDEAQEFCKKLSEQAKGHIRLPTEAEWEYSCRAGTKTAHHAGDSEADLARVAWYSANSKGKTHPVGQKEANAFDLYDMHGNVWQWCQDFYGEDYYGKSEAENPQGSSQGAVRLLRGGSWDGLPVYCRSAYRFGYGPGFRGDIIGFRVVVVPSFRTP